MEMRQLDLKNFSRIVDELPDNWSEVITEIPALEGKAYAMPSFTGSSAAYKVAVLLKEGWWYGKSTCPGWRSKKNLPDPVTPCKHVAAALLSQEEFHFDLIKDEVTVPAKPIEETTSKPDPVLSALAPIEASSEEDSPFLDEVPDASPITRSAAIIAKASPGGELVKPVAAIQETLKVFHAFEDAKKTLLAKNDVQRIGNKGFIKKSGWRKIAVFFGLSLQKLGEREIVSEGQRVYEMEYRAIAPGGQFHDATGYASWDEASSIGRAKKGPEGEAKNEHDVRVTAETRAKNRAISDLVGGGEVSAEEMKAVGTWKE